MYRGELKEGETLDTLYEKFNLYHPDDFTGHSTAGNNVIRFVPPLVIEKEHEKRLTMWIPLDLRKWQISWKRKNITRQRQNGGKSLPGKDKAVFSTVRGDDRRSYRRRGSGIYPNENQGISLADSDSGSDGIWKPKPGNRKCRLGFGYFI